MRHERYPLTEAMADLRAAGLVVTAHVRAGGGWQRVTDGPVPGGFLGAVLDSRQTVPDRLFVALPGQHVHGREYVLAAWRLGAHALTDAPPPPVDEGPDAGVVLQVAEPLAALEILAAAWRSRLSVRIVAVTGSNGKTTTKDLLAAALQGGGASHATRGNLNSAQGVPLSLLDLRQHHQRAVIEMGASAVGHIEARARLVRPEVGVITNAAAAHLEEFGDLASIIAGKGELVAALPTSGRAILNADSPGFDDWSRRATCPVTSWGLTGGQHRWSWSPGDADAPGRLVLDGQAWSVPLPGRHNGANLVAAILGARALGLTDDQIRAGLTGFAPSPHRAHVRRLGGRTLLDDAYNANPASMVAAVGMLCDLAGGESVAVLGHMAELGAASEALHRRCGRELASLPLGRLVTVGSQAAPLAEGYREVGGQVQSCGDPAEAATLLARATDPDDRILIKGSRSAAMERVIDCLIEDHGWREEVS